jgi:hypothetical protein
MVNAKEQPSMGKRWKWTAVACALMLGVVFAVAAQACGPDQQEALACPDPHTGLYDPSCCVVNGSGCTAPCVNPGTELAVCCKAFVGCATDTNPDTETNCKSWFDFWCAPDGGTASATTSGGPTGCAGDCVPLPRDGWSAPQLFWFGDAGAAPACPSDAPVTAYQGNADLVVPDAGSCTPCTCSIDGGSCSFPEHITAGSGTCDDAGTATLAFDPPADWDGGCTDVGAIGAGRSARVDPASPRWQPGR